MESNLFSRFASLIREMSEAELADEIMQPQRLLLENAQAGRKRIEVAYAPFDHVNTDARVVIVGVTPGRQQMRNALLEARRCLRAGHSESQAMAAAKVFASFSGPMRTNLVAMLDSTGISRLLGVPSCGSLWNGDCNLVHFTSALRYPVLVDGKDYSGTPSMVSTPLLRRHLMKWFSAEASMLSQAIFVPLGPKVAEAIELATSEAGIDRNRILSGLPHPSGANAERIAFFLGRKARQDLSPKVEPDRLLAARAALEARVAALQG